MDITEQMKESIDDIMQRGFERIDIVNALIYKQLRSVTETDTTNGCNCFINECKEGESEIILRVESIDILTTLAWLSIVAREYLQYEVTFLCQIKNNVDDTCDVLIERIQRVDMSK